MSQQLTKQAKVLLLDWEASDEVKRGCAEAVRRLFSNKTPTRFVREAKKGKK